MRRHLSANGYGKQTINRVVELLYEGVRHPENWADSKVGKVAEEVDAMNARAYRSVRSGAAEDPGPRVPPDKRNWRAALEAAEPEHSKDEAE